MPREEPTRLAFLALLNIYPID